MTVHRIIGPTIRIVTGEYFDLESPETSKFGILDIAHALSNLCRFTGHCRTFYSVAQHSVAVSNIVPREDALAGLLHDAAEAFIGDVSKPLKMMLPDYARVEARVEEAVLARFGLPPQLPSTVKRADKVLLRTEQRDLMGADEHSWSTTDGVEPLPERIKPLGPNEAFELFVQRYFQLVCS